MLIRKRQAHLGGRRATEPPACLAAMPLMVRNVPDTTDRYTAIQSLSLVRDSSTAASLATRGRCGWDGGEWRLVWWRFGVQRDDHLI
jgi:hypothetical protein